MASVVRLVPHRLTEVVYRQAATQLDRRAATGDERDEKEDEKYDKENLGDFCGQSSDSNKTQNPGDDGDD
jgi:hypothetical protein